MVVRPLVLDEAGVVTAPSHRILGVLSLDNPSGNVTEQVRERDSPAVRGEDGEEVRETVAATVKG